MSHPASSDVFNHKAKYSPQIENVKDVTLNHIISLHLVLKYNFPFISKWLI